MVHEPSQQLYRAIGVAYDYFNKALFDDQLPKVIFTVQRKKGILGYFSPDRWGSLDGKSCHEIAINPAYLAQCRASEVLQTLVHEMVHCWQYCHGTPPPNVCYHNREWAYKMRAVGLMPSDTGHPGGRTTGQHMSDYVIEQGPFFKACSSLIADENYTFSWVDRMALPKLFEQRIFEDPRLDETGGSDDEERPTLSNIEGLSRGRDRERKEEVLESPWTPDPGEKTLGQLMPAGFVVQEAAKKPTRYRYQCPGCATKIYGKPRLNIMCMDCELLFKWGKSTH